MTVDCRALADAVFADLSRRPQPEQKLVAFLIGDDAVSVSFLAQKKKAAERLGVRFSIERIPPGMPERAVAGLLSAHAGDVSVGGIILQLPLPSGYDRSALVTRIPAEKDVDALSTDRLVRSPAVGVCEAIFRALALNVAVMRIAVVGRGLLVGAPIARAFTGRAKQVSVFDIRDFSADALKDADVIISGAGAPSLITGDMVKEGAICIDFGYSELAGKLRGDIDQATVKDRAAYLTPTPGGTGPLLVAKLFENFYALCAVQNLTK
jgi:methylenetetrahydrofolate dehydrogenase (NADP+)/methenyltetrahydrofolate cyclohydrolase